MLFFKMDKFDSNKDKMVSKKEFLDAMSKSWDMHMADVRKMEGDKMGADKRWRSDGGQRLRPPYLRKRGMLPGACTSGIIVAGVRRVSARR